MTPKMLAQTISVRVNGKQKTLPEGITLKGVAELYGLGEKSVVFELNRKVIDRGSYPNIRLKAHDTVEIVRLVGGG